LERAVFLTVLHRLFVSGSDRNIEAAGMGIRRRRRGPLASGDARSGRRVASFL